MLNDSAKTGYYYTLELNHNALILLRNYMINYWTDEEKEAGHYRLLEYYKSKDIPSTEYLYRILSDDQKYNINSVAYYEALERGLEEVFVGLESECDEFVNQLMFEKGTPNKYTI